MIISASYKTDIPAFYADWFLTRLRQGYCRMTNPWGGQTYEVPLGPREVDGFQTHRPITSAYSRVICCAAASQEKQVSIR